MELFAEYARAGWLLCYIPPGSKGPREKGWQRRENAITDPDIAAELPGVGLLHAYSNTAAIDVDNFAEASEWLALHGVSLQDLWDAPGAVKISSGRPNRGKLLYTLRNPLTTIQVAPYTEDGKTRKALEFRCASRGGGSVQDCLPGTIHPTTGKPYTWVFDPMLTHWSEPPELPAALRTLWESLIAAPAPEAAPVRPTGVTADKIRAVLATKNPNCSYDDWRELMSRVNHATQGSDEGLALVDEWSRAGAEYPGFDEVKKKWDSFDPNHPQAVTLNRDLDNLPATADEFPPVPPPTTEQLAAAVVAAEKDEVERKAENKAAKRMALDELEKTLVFVSTTDKYFDTERRISLATDHAIRHLYKGKMPYIRTPQGGRQKADPVNVLMDSTTKRTVDMPGFHPGEGLFFTEDGVRYVNEYIADRVAPIEPTVDDIARIEWLFNRIDDEMFRTYLKQFYGHAIQKPGVKIFSAPLIWSEMTGNGKSTLLQVIPTLLFGQRYTQSVSTSQLASDFNDYLVGKWFVHLSEMHSNDKGDRNKTASKLKAWITDALAINPKGSRGYTTRNSLVITASSNWSDCATVENDDRRLAIHELKAPQMTPEEGRWLYTEFLETPRAAGVLRAYFLQTDLAGFSPTAPAPRTAAREEMILASMGPASSAIYEALEERRGPFALDVCSTQQVYDFLRGAGVYGLSTMTKLGRTLSTAPFNFVQVRPNCGEGPRPRLWIVRDAENWQERSGKEIVEYWNAAGLTA